MEKIYTIRIWFQDHDSIWSIDAGTFNNIIEAENILNKWKSFFEHHKQAFKEVNKEDDWDKWFELSLKYGKIENYDNIEIVEAYLNKDMFIENFVNFGTPDSLKNMIKEWDRDYKIKLIA